MASLAACQAAGPERAASFAGIAPEETVRFTGTEPFWGGEITGTAALYRTPEQPDGVPFTVSRFAGNHGVSFSGTMDGQRFDMMVTPGACSDGMSDRTYPYTATLMLAGQQLAGCAWTDRQAFTAGATPSGGSGAE